MKAEITIHYEPSNMAYRSRRFSEKVSLELREIASEDAPLAVEWEFGRTRWFDGNHYYATGQIPGFDDPSIRREVALSHHLSFCGRSQTDFIGAYIETLDRRSDRKFSETRHPALVDDWRRELALEKLSALSDDCIIVDGRCWIRCGEPRLVVLPETRFHPCHIAIDTRDHSLDGMRFGRFANSPSLEFAAYACRLDDGEVARSICAQMDHHDVALPAFVLHEPGSIGIDDGVTAVEAAAWALCKARNDGSISKTTAVATLEKIDTLDTMTDPNMGVVDHDAVVDVMRELMAELPRLEKERSLQISLVVYRWDNRPIDIGNRPTAQPNELR